MQERKDKLKVEINDLDTIYGYTFGIKQLCSKDSSECLKVKDCNECPYWEDELKKNNIEHIYTIIYSGVDFFKDVESVLERIKKYEADNVTFWYKIYKNTVYIFKHSYDKNNMSWRLPTKEELNLMFKNLHKKGLGGFADNGYYWSSSEYSAKFAWSQDFGDGSQDYNNKDYYFRVRCVRSFESSSIHQVGDEVDDGYIFDIVPYENTHIYTICAKEDLVIDDKTNFTWDEAMKITVVSEQLKLNSLTETQQKISDICDNLKKFLIEKNKRYGNSALEPVRAFSKLEGNEQIKVRLDDKISRLVMGNELKKNDVIDFVGYLILLLIDKNWVDFDDLID